MTALRDYQGQPDRGHREGNSPAAALQRRINLGTGQVRKALLGEPKAHLLQVRKLKVYWPTCAALMCVNCDAC